MSESTQVKAPEVPSGTADVDRAARTSVREYFNDDGHETRLTPLNRFYHEEVGRFYRRQIPRGARVLDLGCGNGDLLASLEPSVGLGVDSASSLVLQARRRHPTLDFVCGDLERLPLRSFGFDYVIASNVVGYLPDLLRFFSGVRSVLEPSTRLICTYYNFAWEPLLKAAQFTGLKSKEPLQNWVSRQDIVNLMELADFEEVASGYITPLPVGPRLLSRPLNVLLSNLPVVKKLGITSYVTARGLKLGEPSRVQDPTCSIIIPTRNERGNIRPALERLPRLGSRTEVVFVDGNSTDGTSAEIRAVMDQYPDLHIELIDQGQGVGMGDAVRKGFAAATGDVLMILDADLTVPPEDLPKFWRALIEDKGEFINGSRLVYPMEEQAMRLANIFGNKFFSLAFSWILDQRITDTLCGTKVLWAADYQRIADNREYFGDFDPFGDFDLLFGATNLNRKIKELPIRYRERTYGTTNINRWRHGVLLLRMALVGARKLRFQ